MTGRTKRIAGYDSVFLAIETKDGRHIGNLNFFDVSPEIAGVESPPPIEVPPAADALRKESTSSPLPSIVS